MLYNQPLATRFGTDFINEINSGKWSRIDVGVAWVRSSALDHLTPHLVPFLQKGARVRFAVGVDLLNTTKEGLQALLDLEPSGDCITYVYHNEAGAIFHPKVYLFRKGANGKLIVGSNNLTGAGLFQNTEAGLAIDGPCSGSPIKDAILALNTWMDISSPLVQQLDDALLTALETNGYIISEAALIARHKAQRKTRTSAKKGKTKLFGSLSVPKPSTPASKSKSAPAGKATATAKPSAKKKSSVKSGATAPKPGVPTGQVLLLRPRLARGTQAQIPLRILSGGFFKGQLHAKSVATGVDRPISFTHPKTSSGKKSANPNTAKIELPEAAAMANPVVRFVRSASGIEFEVWDESSAQGASVKNSLDAGLKLSPAKTFLTLPSNPNSATWWRFI